MNALRAHHLLRIIVALATFLGWVLLSNHCAIDRLAAQKAHGCCHTGPAQPADRGQNMDCCKALHAVVPDAAKIADPPRLITADMPVAWLLPERAPLELARVDSRETGPPRAAAFSELVLHRSLRSHAPPYLA